ncbi:hypothetical protein [Nitrosococcus watsonii]|uniref:Uncharacterized protein n=1 Tax=Nitrosococcus watsoni (strain C-113) TaxID=105559 RepID=D8K5S3_NITWC|nr:hypothetical protein [Nitrosococcus watsonii]ADJ28250.1 hypothetical protein Nwat_1328 [Nitrosococcus watsonii C-113]
MPNEASEFAAKACLAVPDLPVRDRTQTGTAWLSRQRIDRLFAHQRNTIATRTVLGDRDHLGDALGLPIKD